MKIAIIRWFQHFGKALPAVGLGILLATVILAFLSVPYAVRAHDFGEASTPELATEEALVHGRTVLTTKCVTCHDLRTILARPYAPDGWHRVVLRMAKKPQLGARLAPEDLGPVTAYLVAITPEIQDAVSDKRRESVAQAERAQAVKARAPGGVAPDRRPRTSRRARPPTRTPAASVTSWPTSTRSPHRRSPAGARSSSA